MKTISSVRCRPAAALLCVLLVFPALAQPAPNAVPGGNRLPPLDPAGLERMVRTLAGDEFEGRAPGSPGEERTVDYLVARFKEFGLKPGNPDGTYVQQVPLVGYRSDTAASIQTPAGRIDLVMPRDCVAWSPRLVPESRVTGSELVFVGYGVVAPEYGWDDFKGVDVKGKTLVMLINDPAIPDPADPTKLDPSLFKGRAMTYYGRWTYKYEMAMAKGAAAAIIVHETEPAAYPWMVVVGSNYMEKFALETPDRDLGRVAVEGWITVEKARELFAVAGQDFSALKQAALRRDFKPVPLGLRADFSVTNTIRKVASRNVVARLEGADRQGRDECVIYTAHWDHLGRNPKLEGDQIFNGARDNASGTGALLELARAFTRFERPPRRSILFLAVTAEEKGLLGAQYYATHPLYPLNRTLANVNMDVINTWGRTRDVSIIGYGQNTLEDVLAPAAARQGRTLVPDPQPEKGGYYRSDHFEFAKVGVPALYLQGGVEYVGRPPGWGLARREEFTAKHYHKVSDEVEPDWDWTGALEDLQLLMEVGWSVANGDEWPRWKDGSEFKARRESMLGADGRRP